MPHIFLRNIVSHWQETTQKTEDSVLILSSYKPHGALGTWEFTRVKNKVVTADICVSSCEASGHEQQQKCAWRDT